MHVLAVARPNDVLRPVDAWSVGRLLLEGHIPYRDFQFEYPPLAALAFLLPGLVPHGLAKLVLALQAVVLELVAIAFIRRYAGALKRYLVLSFLLFPYLPGGFDAFPMAALAVSTALFAQGSPAGWAVVATGTMMKLSPGLAWIWCRRRPIVAAGALAVTAAVILGPVALATNRDDDWLTYNLDRGVQVESVAASSTWVVRQLNGHPSTIEYRFKAFEIDHASPAAALWAGAGAIGLIWIAARARGRDAWALALLTLDVFLVSSRVLSPQYFAWTAPLAAVVGRRTFVLHLVMAGLTVLTSSLVDHSQAFLAMAALRNAVLVGTAAWGLWRLRAPAEIPIPTSGSALAPE
jgi:hypothetical protein